MAGGTKLRLTRRKAVQGAAALAALGPAAARAQGPARLALRLMATSDLHVNTHPYDYYRDRGDDTVGLARTAALVETARREAANSLLFDNGDIIQGSPLGDYVAYEKGVAGGAHPIVAAMNTLGYDCATLGNHEFNYGLAFLERAMARANFPFVCCNVTRPDGWPAYRPWILLERTMKDAAGAEHKLKIGVIGFVPPQIMRWDQAHLEGRVATLDIVEAARRFVPGVRRAGADIVIALCHSGIAKTAPAAGEENAARGLAAVGGIDAMILGHQHLVFPGKDFEGIEGVDAKAGAIAGVPAVMPGFWGSHLGVLDLDIEKSERGWRVAAFRVETRPIYERTPDRRIVAKVGSVAAVLAAAEADHQAALTYVRAPVGETKSPINSFFALVRDDPSVQIVAQAQIAEVARLAAADPALRGLPVLSAAAPFKSGGRGGPDYYTDVKPGPIAIKDVADIYLYPNTLRAVRIDGATVREWLEMSAGIFRRIDPGRTDEQELIDPAFPAFNFDVIDGVAYRIDVTQPARYDDKGKLVNAQARRIVDLSWKGAPIDEKQMFLVATNNYRAAGGGNFPGCDGRTIVIEAPDTNRDVIVRYIVDKKTIEPAADGNWRFAPWPDSAVVTFVTSPSAAAALPPDLKAEPAGDAPGGFVKYRLRS
ncbi:MAG: bifunctional 2',3'-cyclic-nucleotide 2'-phosphodiesterase/3'-nucleotidase [Methylobacteriaceae bacterium]|nr:bifunctional 2',3'-cyclic-nucleotide 2'-phosphodiesterase/3'-nucleotidase [Methylobacteriaceae bacterium]